MGTGEDTARKRVSRALEKLRAIFFAARRGVPAGSHCRDSISAHSVQAAPATLAKSISVVAVAKGATASSSTLTLIKGAFKIMAWTKTKIIAATAVVAIAGISAITIAVKQRGHSHPVTVTSPGDWIWEANSQTLERVPPLLLVQPTTLRDTAVPFEMFGNKRYLARGRTLKQLIAGIYSQKDSQFEIFFPEDRPNDRYDCIVTLQGNWPDTLQTEIEKQFNLTIKPDYAKGQVLVAKKPN